MAEKSTYPLRMPAWVKAEAEKLAGEHGTSLNHFVSLAVAEKVSALRSAEFFAKRKGQVDWDAFERIMNRKTDAPTIPGDEVPEGYVRPPFKRPTA